MADVKPAIRAVAGHRAAPEARALEIHDDGVQRLTAIHWALEADVYDQARAATQATLAQAQAIISELLDGDGCAPGGLRRRRDN